VLYILPFLGFVLLWYLIGLRLAVWRAFGIEEITVAENVMCWTRTAFIWKRELKVSTKDITEVKAVAPWHALSYNVEFTASGNRHSIGDMLLRDEASDIAHALRKATGLAG